MFINLELTIKLLEKAKDYAVNGRYGVQYGNISMSCLLDAASYCRDNQSIPFPLADYYLAVSFCEKSLTYFTSDAEILSQVDKRTFIRILDFTIAALKIQVRSLKNVQETYPHLSDILVAMSEGIPNADKLTYEEEKKVSTVEQLKGRKISFVSDD